MRERIPKSDTVTKARRAAVLGVITGIAIGAGGPRAAGEVVHAIDQGQTTEQSAPSPYRDVVQGKVHGVPADQDHGSGGNLPTESAEWGDAGSSGEQSNKIAKVD